MIAARHTGTLTHIVNVTFIVPFIVTIIVNVSQDM